MHPCSPALPRPRSKQREENSRNLDSNRTAKAARSDAEGRPASTKPTKQKGADTQAGNAGELHQIASGAHPLLTTNQGTPIADNQNSLRANPRGPTLLEDFILREKITHFDHERIPERVVHARGTGAHGFFELTSSLGKYTTAKVLTEIGERKPIFALFSTVAGGAGSGHRHRTCR